MLPKRWMHGNLWSDNRNLVNVLRVLGLVISVRYDSHTVTSCLINLYVLSSPPPDGVAPWVQLTSDCRY